MRDIEITVAKWFKAGLTSAAVCAFGFALASYALGRWHSLLVLPIGFIIGSSVEWSLGESSGRWPARTAAVWTLLADILAKAGGFYFSVSLDIEQAPGRPTAAEVLDFTFRGLNIGDFFLVGLSLMIAYLKAFRSTPTAAEAASPAAVSADRIEGTSDSVLKPGIDVGTAVPDETDREISVLDVKRFAVTSNLMMSRITMLLVAAVTLFTQADVVINARQGLEKEVRRQLPFAVDEIDPDDYEQLMNEGVRDIRLWGIACGLVGLATLIAAVLIHRAPIAANATVLVLFSGSWATDAYLGKPMSPGVIVVKIVVILVLILALNACLEFKKECRRVMESGGRDVDGA